MKKDAASSLIAAGIKLIAKKGTKVSLREIQRKAGALNEGAIRYYFGGKEGFISACMEDISKRFRVIIAHEFVAFEGMKSQRAVTVEDAASSLVTAFRQLWLQDNNSVWFMARMSREEGDFGRDLLISCFDFVIWRLEAELKVLLPQKKTDMIRLHLFLAINNVLNGLVDQDFLWRLPGTDGHERFQLDHDDFLRGFIKYITAGMSVEA